MSIPKKVINLYSAYTLGRQLRNLNTVYTSGKCLFGSVKLTKNADLDKYKHTCYGFDSRLLFTDESYRKNVIIFGADMSLSVHVDNKRKDILLLGKGLTQGLNDTTLTVGSNYPINFTQSRKRFVLSLHYNGTASCLLML